MNAGGGNFNSAVPGNNETYPNIGGFPQKTNAPGGPAHGGPSDSMGSMGSITSGQITAKFGGGSMTNTQGRGSLAATGPAGGSAGSVQGLPNHEAQMQYKFNTIGYNEANYAPGTNPAYGAEPNYTYGDRNTQ